MALSKLIFNLKKNIRNTARKALKPFWLNAERSEVSKIARLDPVQSCLKVTKNLLFQQKWLSFFVTLRQLCAESRHAKRT